VPSLIEYHRLSKAERKTGAVRLGLSAQAKATSDGLAATGHTSAGVLVDDGVTSRLPIHKRPALAEALERIRTGNADGLIAMNFDRIARDVDEFRLILSWANHPRTGWALVIPGFEIDTTTADGKLLATVRAAVAEHERGKISERTKAALAAKVAAGHTLGGPVLVTPSASDRMRALKLGGMSTRKIAQTLTAEGFPVPRGGRSWSHSTVAYVLSK
jgi:DNA invertase Pin-like site-specific DNA recombinase